MTEPTQRTPRVMIVEDDPLVGEWLNDFLEVAGLAPVWHHDPLKAIGPACSGEFDVILLDIMMPGMDGITFLRKVKEAQPSVEAVMLTARGDATLITRAIKLNAFDYLVKPTNLQKILATIKAAMTRRLQSMSTPQETWAPGSVVEGFVIAGTESSRLAVEAQRVAPYFASLLIQGPPGTGKRHLARLIHHFSGRPADRLVVVDLAEIPASEAQTRVLGALGPWASRAPGEVGALKRADGGTLVLAHVDCLPLSVQGKLTTLLDSGQILEPPFEDEDFLDVKLIATTTLDLDELVKADRLLDEFHRRLRVAEIFVKPLAERFDEVILLARHLLAEASAGLGKQLDGFVSAAERLLLEYPWPDNVAEMRRAVESAARSAPGSSVGTADLPARVRDHGRQLGYQAAEQFLKS
ncbi:MAG: sigma-54-dependent Fis family transcriptional regulator [Candidatus Riflebacteria bacterium]|nr:sigma-54-dependent Fis family transcriptional regulator [Candidatus Riflebacteria bacterium]